MSEKVQISVVIIAKNEEAQIADCLASAAFADDLVVVDDCSTDRTVEIARQTTGHILSRKMDIEGRHRNWAYALAKHDWVFSLDADERITPELAEELAALVRQGPPPHVVYSTPIRAYIGRIWIQHGGWYPGRKDRFFDRRKFRYEEAEVHPRPIINGSHGRLSGDVIHYSYRGFADFLASVNNQTTLEAKKWARDGRRMGLFVALWRTVDRFFRSYILKAGYKDGWLGFMVAWFAASYQLLSYAKYWELRRAQAPTDG